MTLQMWVLPTGERIEVGDRDDVGEMLGISGKTYMNYVRNGNARGDPAPSPVGIDPVTRRDLFPMWKILEWHLRRPGPGDRGGAGARKRWARVILERIAAEEDRLDKTSPLRAM